MSEHKKLIRLIARAFYAGDVPPKTANSKSRADKADQKGLAVLIIDALTRRQWVKEEDLANVMKLHPKQLRRTLRFLEQDMMVRREHRREKPPPKANFSEEDEASRQPHTFSYASIDYARAIDMTRLRLYHIRRKLEEHVAEKKVEQVYLCPNCGRRYSSLDAMFLATSGWRCEDCTVEVQRELGATGAAGDDEAILQHKREMKAMLDRMDAKMAPIKDSLRRIRDAPAPNYGSLHDWVVARHLATSQGHLLHGANGGHGGGSGKDQVQIDILGDMTFEVQIEGMAANEASSSGNGAAGLDEAAQKRSIIPPWMRREGMPESDNSLKPSADVDEKNIKTPDGILRAQPRADIPKPVDESVREEDGETQSKAIDEASLQAEYVKAYLAALQEAQNAELGSAVHAPDSSALPATVPEASVGNMGGTAHDTDMGEADDWEDVDAKEDNVWEDTPQPDMEEGEDDEWEDV